MTPAEGPEKCGPRRPTRNGYSCNNALERVEKIGNAQTRVIPGHGPVATKTELRAAHEMWATINQRLEAMAKQGRTIDEVLKAAPTKDFDPKIGARTAEGFLRQAYDGEHEFQP